MTGRIATLLVATVASLVVVLLSPPLLPLEAATQRDGSLDVVLGELPCAFFEGVPDAPPGGALVLEVLSGGAGDQKGLVEGDVIVEFEGEPVTSAFELAGRIRREGEGSMVSIKVWRDGRSSWIGIARLSGRTPPALFEDEVFALRSEVAALRDEVAGLREAVLAREE